MTDVKVTHDHGGSPARVLPGPTGPEWEQPLIAAVIAAGLPADAPCGCGLPLAAHDGPLTRGQGGYRDVWFGSRKCWGGPGVPGSRRALRATYGTANPTRLSASFAPTEDVASARAGQRKLHRKLIHAGVAIPAVVVFMALLLAGLV